MADEGPLSEPRLRVIEQTIDAGKLDEAQHLLADLGEDSQLGRAAFYLATRILYLRGRLEADAVAERLRDLLTSASSFPEAEAMLAAAESGSLNREGPVPKPEAPSPSQRPTVIHDAGDLGDLTLPTDPRQLDDDWDFGIDASSSQRPLGQPSWPPPPPGAAANGKRPSERATAAPPEWPPSQKPVSIKRPAGAEWPSIPELRAQVGGPAPEAEPPTDAPVDKPGTGTDWLPEPGLPDSAIPPAVEAEAYGGDGRPHDDPPRSSPIPTVRPREHMPTPVQDFSAPADRASDGSPLSESAQRKRAPEIPPAPGLPHFSPPPNRPASQAPDRRSAVPDRTRSSDAPPSGPLSVKRSGPPREFDADPSGDRVSGRYSGFPKQRERVFSKPRSRSSRPPERAGGRSSRPSEPRKKIHSSAPPPPAAGTAPTRSELAQLLDEGKYTAVLEAIGPDRQEAGPDHVLLKARALAGLERHDEARSTLQRFGAAPLLDPEYRASGARVLIEIGDYEAAFHQTSRAFAEAPGAAPVRLAHAWAALRLARRRDTSAMANTADTALSGLKSRQGPYPQLVLALRACVQAHVGDAERAISQAQRALTIEPRCADAHVALALAAGRLHRAHDARLAWLRVRQNAPQEAEAVAARLARLGVPLPALTASEGLAAAGEAAASLWDSLEIAVLAGKHEEGVSAFERQCRDRLSDLVAGGGDQSFPGIARLAVKTLTTAPVWQNFAPYDLSLWSVARVAAALGVLYGPQPLRRDEADEFPVVALLGSYLGEVLCETHEARWEGSIMDLDNVRVVAWEGKWTPFQLVQRFLKQRASLEFELPSATRSAHPGADPWARRSTPSIAPPAPWDPDLWPRVDTLRQVGRAVSHSVMSRYCELRAGGPLDGSIASLTALDGYLSLVTPMTQRAEAGAPWIPRLVVLTGAYVGEVLCEVHGGEWEDAPKPPPSPSGYRLKLAGGRVATPLAQVFDRITGQSTAPTRDYVTALIK